jgi:hypothetical protein
MYNEANGVSPGGVRNQSERDAGHSQTQPVPWPAVCTFKEQMSALASRRVCWTVLAAALSFDACARALQQPVGQSSALQLHELWREPDDLETRDLFHGPGGAALTPSAITYSFVARKTRGTNPGYDVRDPEGRLWSVKLGEEAQSEVTSSRILWAIGFHQPATYYVERWTLSGADTAEQPAGRFRPDLPGQTVTGNWSWYDNPFIGSRPLAALVAVNLLLNNWDFKTSNNTVYLVRNEDGVEERQYVVRDLGGSLGKAKQPRVLSWFPFMRQQQGSKNNLEDFEAQGFVRDASGETVEFDYRGIDGALVDSVAPADLRWTGELLSRLSERQWLDAFRAGGYSADQSERYVRKIREKVGQATGP